MLLRLKNFLWTILDFICLPLQIPGKEERQEKKWRQEAILRGATHIIVYWDSVEMESVPVFVMSEEKKEEICSKIKGSNTFEICKVIEIES